MWINFPKVSPHLLYTVCVIQKYDQGFILIPVPLNFCVITIGLGTRSTCSFYLQYRSACRRRKFHNSQLYDHNTRCQWFQYCLKLSDGEIFIAPLEYSQRKFYNRQLYNDPVTHLPLIPILRGAQMLNIHIMPLSEKVYLEPRLCRVGPARR